MAPVERNGTDPLQLREGEPVVAAVAMPGVPEGTKGRVTLVEGLTWIRYWVRFDNGVQRGSLHRQKLARPHEWAELLYRREHGVEDEEAAAQSADGADEEAAAGAGAAAGEAGADKVVGGATVPAHLLERTKKRLEDLGVSR